MVESVEYPPVHILSEMLCPEAEISNIKYERKQILIVDWKEVTAKKNKYDTKTRECEHPAVKCVSMEPQQLKRIEFGDKLYVSLHV